MGRSRKHYKNLYCNKCLSPNTFINKNGQPLWYTWHEIDGIIYRALCNKCYNKYINEPKRVYNRIYNPTKHHKITRKYYENNRLRRLDIASEHCFRYKGRSLWFEESIRCGVCNLCRAIVRIDCHRTDRHHDEDRYDDSNPLRYTLEICRHCHNIETFRIRKEKGLRNKNFRH